jgi:hypothetical protein
MAPIKHLLKARISHSSHSSHSSGGGGAPIGGGVVAAIIGCMILIFIIAFVYQYRKGHYLSPLYHLTHCLHIIASRIRAETNTPIPKGKIFKNAALIAISFGLIGLCFAECLANTNAPAAGSGGGQIQQMDMNGGGFVQPPPMPNYTPPMDFTPISNAAQAPIQ